MKVNFGRMLLQSANQYTDRKALVNVERNRTFTFNELHILTNKISNMMKERFGLESGDVYGTLLENDNNSLINVWLFKSESSGLWLNYRDSLEEQLYQIDYVNTKLLFVEEEILQREYYYKAFRDRNITIISMDRPKQSLEGVYYFWDLVDDASDTETGVEYDIDNHIILFRFTGGTTGKGKCTMYTLRNVLGGFNNLFAQDENIVDGNTRHLHVTPLSHASASFLLPIYFKGGCQYTINQPNLNYFCEVVQNHKINTTMLVPTLLYLLAEHGYEELYDLSSLEFVIYGASPMSPAKLEMLQSKLGNIFLQGYGSSEAWPSVLILGKADHIIKTDIHRKRLSSAGKPLPGVELRIVDDNEMDVPVGTTGEIWVRGANVIKGYYKNPEETSKGFSDNGFWKSGDMGYMDEEGYVFIVDRKKDMIISGGFNVYAIEVENALNSHPAVQQSAVVGIPHEKWGEAVHGEVILKQDMKISERELIEFAKHLIGKYKVPKSITFVEELPLSSVGKVLRKKVRDKYWKDTERRVH